MLEDYGLHELIWNTADQFIGGEFVASPTDVEGRGIALTVREDGAAANLTGATAYFLWCHRATGERGACEFEAVDASSGAFRVYYPGAMCAAAGAVDAQVMVDLGEGRKISTWALPSSGVSGSQTFYNCNNLVGGNGTTYASSRNGYQYFRIDLATSPGYLSVK